jgi:hypothetical protein
MDSSFENVIPKFDLNDFIRNIYPGLIIASFLFFKEPSIKTVIGQDQLSISFFFLVLVLISGFLFTGLYRGIVFVCIRWFEKKMGKFPQYEFHMQIVHELLPSKQLTNEKISQITQKLEDISLISACAHRILLENDDDIFRKELSFANGQVHLVYSTFILFLLGFFFSLYSFGFFSWFTIIFLILSIFLLIGGLVFNYHIDMRETLFVIKNKEEYSKLLDLYINFLIK